MDRAERIRLLRAAMLTSRVIDVRFEKYPRRAERWVVRVQITGEILYRFRFKWVAVLVGDVVAREREMLLFVRDRKAVVKEKRDYRKPAFSN